MSTIAPTGRDYDPVTLEVIRMRLDAIVDEMAIAMMRSSGSPVITEAGDFNTALFDAEGRIYAYSNYVQFHIGSASVALRGLLDVVPREEMEPGRRVHQQRLAHRGLDPSARRLGHHADLP